MKETTNQLTEALKHFFSQYLPLVRGVSPHTVHSYRDAFALLLRFLKKKHERSLAKLGWAELDSAVVLDFLDDLQQNRHNQPVTRNARLAAFHAFFRYLPSRYPELTAYCQQMLAIPFKRVRTATTEYFEYDEIKAILNTINRNDFAGRRDYALLVTMFNTGGRIQELLDVRPCDLQCQRPYQVRLLGKGRKERICPLWPQTAALLKNLFEERGLETRSQEKVFCNQRRGSLTRFGARYILAKYCRIASRTLPSLKQKRLHPHSMRHSTAVHLLKAGVDLVSISHWLGHASVETTNRYTFVDLETKREAIAKLALPEGVRRKKILQKDEALLTWLEAL